MNKNYNFSKRYYANLFFALLFLLCPAIGFSQVKVIFDTDFGGDVDDLGALCMLNKFMDTKECEVLAVMCGSTEQYAVSAIDAVNRFYKHRNIPIGSRKGSVYHEAWHYSKSIADQFKAKRNYANVPEATALYRKILAESADSSLVIVTVGPLKNIQNLIQSPADHYSGLSGKELIVKKVREVVVMGGRFPQSTDPEWNFDGNMPGVTRFVLNNLSVPIVFSGAEVGGAIKVGEDLSEIDKNTPLYIGWLHFSRNAPWMKKLYTGGMINNACFDQTAVLYAVRNDAGIYWDKIKGGFCEVDDKGNNKWVSGSDTNQSFLKLKASPKEMASLIKSLMLH